ncbi:MAG TPA: ArsR family transcriptional regulator, partial [Bryobacterales bacterium]|nr:ArsR family transcriptional regulator [Bryobacterales bacterium]
MKEILGALRAAGEVTRLRLLAVLSQGEFNVTELTRILQQSQPRISRHLKLMTEAG